MPNQLIHETSPYLLQHAHNPVDWHPWGEEALQKAKKEDKVILISIGYSACHWCHVMERESFEDEATAEIMNDYFINIKIDREERPDLDGIYMDAVQAISGSGGWPLNVFLTPELKPFYGGTYFPPQRAFNRSSWTEILEVIQEAWKERRHEVEEQANKLTEHLQKSNSFTQKVFKELNTQDKKFTIDDCKTIAENCLKNGDTVWGGFGKAPKFPQTFTIAYLLQYYHFTKDKNALDQALLSLDKMAQGGIYDQIGGGFARYSTDEEWLIPHFEKMLYDNALLINVLCDAYQITKNEEYEKVIKQTIDFLQREMRSNEGGFYAALDADSEGEEGKFYVWQKEEIEDILGKDADLLCKYFDISEKGNWIHEHSKNGVNILRILKTKNEFLKQEQINEKVFDTLIVSSSKKLLEERNKRVRPGLDDKVLLNWNALLITALCKAAATFNDAAFKKLAEDTFVFIKKSFTNDEFFFYHTYKKGQAKYEAYLDDYAYLIQACIALQEITSNIDYLIEAEKLTNYVIENFSDEENIFFYYTHQHQKNILVRKKEIYDGATPSGNSVMAENLLYLSIVFDKTKWLDRSRDMLQGILPAVTSYPTSFGNWAVFLLKQTVGINELVIAGKNYVDIRNDLLQYYIPNKVLQCTSKEVDFPLLRQKNFNQDILIYLCKNYECSHPVSSLADLLLSLNKSIE